TSRRAARPDPVMGDETSGGEHLAPVVPLFGGAAPPRPAARGDAESPASEAAEPSARPVADRSPDDADGWHTTWSGDVGADGASRRAGERGLTGARDGATAGDPRAGG